jgi:hypothetical protein
MSVDYPRGWQLARAVPFTLHDPACSYRQTTGAILCDCEVVMGHEETLDPERMFGLDGVELVHAPVGVKS